MSVSELDFERYVRFRAILSRCEYSTILSLPGFNRTHMYARAIRGDITTGLELCGRCGDVYEFLQRDLASTLQVNHCSHSHLIHMLLPQEYCEQLIDNNGAALHDFALTTHCDLVLEPTPLPFTDEHVIEIYGSEIHLIDTVARLLLSSRHYHVRQPYSPSVTDDSTVIEVSSDSSMDLGTNDYLSGDAMIFYSERSAN